MTTGNRALHRLAQPAYPFGAPLRIGHMRQAEPVKGEPLRHLRFHYNPNAITVSYTTEENLLNPALRQSEDFGVRFRFKGSMGLSFNLLFDRSYEMHMENDGEGVLHDIRAMEHLLQIHHWGALWTVPIQFFFGGGNPNDFKHTSNLSFQNGFVFVGYVTGATVQYLKFSQNMVPMTAEVSITAAQLVTEVKSPRPPTTSGGAVSTMEVSGLPRHSTVEVSGLPRHAPASTPTRPAKKKKAGNNPSTSTHRGGGSAAPARPLGARSTNSKYDPVSNKRIWAYGTSPR